MWRAELEAIQIEIPTQGNAERNTSSDKCKAVHKCTGWVDRWLLEPSSKIFFAFPSYCVAVDMKSSSEGGTKIWWSHTATAVVGSLYITTSQPASQQLPCGCHAFNQATPGCVQRDSNEASRISQPDHRAQMGKFFAASASFSSKLGSSTRSIRRVLSLETRTDSSVVIKCGVIDRRGSASDISLSYSSAPDENSLL